MIIGIGTDIVEINRIKDAVEKWGEGFLKRVFTGNEISYCLKRSNPYPHFAARFAAKEAFIKAYTGMKQIKGKGKKTPNFGDIEVLNEPTGRPYIKVSEEKFFKSEPVSVHLSMSHEKSHAIAVVILETKNG